MSKGQPRESADSRGCFVLSGGIQTTPYLLPHTVPASPDETGRNAFDDEFVVLLFEFKVQIAEYLSRLRNTRMRTLGDLIASNREHCDEELRWYGQEIFELAEAASGDRTDPEYLAAKATTRNFGRRVINGYRRQGFDAILTPSNSFATSVAATAGSPDPERYGPG